MPFLTLEDPNAKVKGSRDPLGLQPAWAAFGRRVVTNLTNASNSTRGFTTLLLGRYFGERLIRDGVVGCEDALAVVLRMEQLAGYARFVGHGDEEIRGIERIRRALDDGRGQVPIQADSRGMILSDQKIYGLWGLFSVSARTSGMLMDGPVGLQEATREFVEAVYLPVLEPVLPKLNRLLSRGGVLNTRGGDPVFKSLAGILPPHFTPDELEFYRAHLRDGLHVKTAHPGRQRTLTRLMRSEIDLTEWIGREQVLRLAEAARAVDPGLAMSLDRIAHLEATIAPAAVLFDHVLTRNGQQPSDVAERLTELWGNEIPNLDQAAFSDLLPEIRDASTREIANDIWRCHQAMAAGDYEEAIYAVLDWNRRVMALRGSGPWVQRGSDGRLDVRYRGDEQLLPDGDELTSLWRNTYFLDSLRQITWQLEERP